MVGNPDGKIPLGRLWNGWLEILMGRYHSEDFGVDGWKS
jgi:hypothetical protein